jgi:hypothetical protein
LKQLDVPTVRGVKPRAAYVKSELVAASVVAAALVFRHSAFWQWLMLHLRARGLAPLTLRGNAGETLGNALIFGIGWVR